MRFSNWQWKTSKYLSAIILATALILGLTLPALGQTLSGISQPQERSEVQLAEQSLQIVTAIEQAAAYLQQQDSWGDWVWLALLRGDLTAADSAQEQLFETLRESSTRLVTNLLRGALAYSAASGNLQDVAGRNILAEVFSHENMTGQGTLGPAYSLILLQAAAYTPDQSALWDEVSLVDWLLAAQTSGGGWPLALHGAAGIDTTAVVITALSPYIEKPEVAQALAAALDWLRQEQAPNGAFALHGGASESIAQTIIGLSTLGLDANGRLFTPQQDGLVSRLLQYQQADGGFAHQFGETSNGMATEQALLALIAYDRYLKGDVGLYRLMQAAELRIESPQRKLLHKRIPVNGNVLEVLIATAEQAGVDVEVTSSSFGDYVSAIGGVEAGTYGGFDGWSFHLIRGGNLINPTAGMADYIVENGDQVVVYYTSYQDTNKLHRVTEIDSSEPNKRIFEFEQSSWNWAEKRSEISPAANVPGAFGDAGFTSNDEGQITLQRRSPGLYVLNIHGQRENAALRVVPESVLIYEPIPFRDLQEASAWAEDAILLAGYHGWMLGIGGDRFAPKQALTRAEYVALLLRIKAIEIESSVAHPFVDVAHDRWYTDLIGTAYQAGWIAGVATDRFAPDHHITRADLAVLLHRLYTPNEAMNPQNPPTDLADVPEYARTAVLTMMAKGWIQGANGQYMPQEQVSREMAAVIIARIQADGH